MSTARTYSKQVKQRFVQAIEKISKERYPKEREVDIIKSIGLSPTNYYRLRVTENNYPTLDHCAILCDKYKISAEWLLLGKGYMKKIEAKNLKPLELIKQAVEIMSVTKKVTPKKFIKNLSIKKTD